MVRIISQCDTLWLGISQDGKISVSVIMHSEIRQDHKISVSEMVLDIGIRADSEMRYWDTMHSTIV